MSKTFSANASHDEPSSRVGALSRKFFATKLCLSLLSKNKFGGDYIEPLIFSLVKWLSSIKLTHYQENIIQQQEMSDFEIWKCLVLAKEVKKGLSLGHATSYSDCPIANHDGLLPFQKSLVIEKLTCLNRILSHN